MTVIGLDVGYSNLKIAVGEAVGSPRMIVRPAGAAPVDRLGEQIGAARLQDAILVEVDGQRWAAAIDSATCAPPSWPTRAVAARCKARAWRWSTTS